jgi:hypothetical protein
MLTLVGRPSDFTPELGERICELAASGMSMLEISAQEGMPARSTIYLWLYRATGEEGTPLRAFSDRYARAREFSAQALADRVYSIAADGSRDYTIETDENGVEVRRVDYEHIQRSKLIVDSLKWQAEKYDAVRYGQRTAHQMLDEHGKPAALEIKVTRVERKRGSGDAG